jgi:hypothetical protein
MQITLDVVGCTDPLSTLLYRTNVIARAIARSNLPFYRIFLFKGRLLRRQKESAAARNDINFLDVQRSTYC